MKAAKTIAALSIIGLLGGCGVTADGAPTSPTLPAPTASTAISSSTTTTTRDPGTGTTATAATRATTTTESSTMPPTLTTTSTTLPTPTPTSTTSPTSTTTSTTPPTSTTTRTSTTTTSTTVAASCTAPPTPLPAGAADVTSLSGDIDGDGAADLVTGYRLGTEWYLHVALADGWGTALRVDTITIASSPAAGPVVVADPGGDRLLVADLGGILPGRFYGFFEFRDCELVPVTLSSGELPTTYVGGGLHHSEWFTCDSGRVVQVTAVREDDPEFGALSAYTYRYDPVGGHFIDEGEEIVVLDPPAALDGLLADYPSCIPG